MPAVQQMQQISSLAQADAQVAHATRPARFKYLNLPFLAIVAAIAAYGLIVVYSATAAGEASFTRQAAGVAVGAVLMLLVFRFDYHQLSHYLVLFLILNVVLILSPHLPLIGDSAKGAVSWVRLGPVRLQPSEFAKVMVILLDASVMCRYRDSIARPTGLLKALGLMLVPFLCIMTQPDLGTGLVYLSIEAVALVVGGARPRHLVILAGIAVAGVAAIFVVDPILDEYFGRDVLLKDYQWARLLVFLDDTYDLSGDGYNLRQAKIAIGSGGLLGKGFMNSTQQALGYLPEAHTDFIFCVLAEQFGFLGSMLLIALYALLIWQCYRIAYNANDIFGTLIVMCAAGMWLFQVLENIGMCCGLMPITGIPLPFMSYGSSFMIVNFILLGAIGSVWAHSGKIGAGAHG